MAKVDPSYLLIAPILGAFLGAIFSFVTFWALNQINIRRERAIKELETLKELFHDIGQLRIHLITLAKQNPEEPMALIFFWKLDSWEQNRHLIEINNADFLILSMVYGRIQIANGIGQTWQFGNKAPNKKQIVSNQKSYLCNKDVDDKIDKALSILAKRANLIHEKLELPKWVKFLYEIFK
ncbi:MAG: hypothetical protein KC553_01885 [Nitrospina sp.]|nr:hypothetical protein [Nitrospina sp.]